MIEKIIKVLLKKKKIIKNGFNFNKNTMFNHSVFYIIFFTILT